jgi:hypothetical protein
MVVYFKTSQEELYKVQREKETRPITHYDLSVKPKLKKSDRMKSLSMSNIHTVRPVESAGSTGTVSIEVRAFDSPKVPIKNAHIVGQLNAINRKIEEMNSARKVIELSVIFFSCLLCAINHCFK